MLYGAYSAVSQHFMTFRVFLWVHLNVRNSLRVSVLAGIVYLKLLYIGCCDFVENIF